MGKVIARVVTKRVVASSARAMGTQPVPTTNAQILDEDETVVMDEAQLAAMLLAENIATRRG